MQHDEFTRAAEQYTGLIYRVAFGYLRSVHDAEDTAQNVLIKLYRRAGGFDSDEHLKYWLVRVTVNECKKALKSPRYREAPLDELAQAAVFDELREGELFQTVMAMERKYRAVLLLYYYADYSTAETARILSVPAATVRTRLARAREQLKHILTEQEEII